MATDQELEIARWMLEEFTKFGQLRQSRAASGIRQTFGEQFVYRNANRNWAINKTILEEFRKLTPADTVWSRSRQLWRKRRDSDPPDSRMVK